MKVIYKILLVCVLGTGTVAGLYLFQPAPAKNGFMRGGIYTAQKLGSLELKFNHWYINELDSARIYLCNYKARLNGFSCSYKLSDSLYRKLPFADESRFGLQGLKKSLIYELDPKGDGFRSDGFVN